MHPDLSEARLSSLPLAIWRHAKSALSPSTPTESVSCYLRRLIVECVRARDKGYTARSLLPVVYAVLGDPKDLPNPETTPEPLYRARVCCVGHAFALFTCCTQLYTSPALNELAPRIWAWIQFMDIHEYVPRGQRRIRRQVNIEIDAGVRLIMVKEKNLLTTACTSGALNHRTRSAAAACPNERWIEPSDDAETLMLVVQLQLEAS
ncbi:hypothetical protein R3P38DRAFT_3275347 [Favolaschia claudopus]|uniref:Uncharacterized protein n=1 Tax=Favolaschia claudopus TaxID=2862362 RepID=A0AAW0AWW7_9AGAR